jgi:hypothetical protein
VRVVAQRREFAAIAAEARDLKVWRKNRSAIESKKQTGADERESGPIRFGAARIDQRFGNGPIVPGLPFRTIAARLTVPSFGSILTIQLTEYAG